MNRILLLFGGKIISVHYVTSVYVDLPYEGHAFFHQGTGRQGSAEGHTSLKKEKIKKKGLFSFFFLRILWWYSFYRTLI